MKLAVYGSLRKGLHNHFLLKKSKLIGTEVVSVPYIMVSLGSFPALIPDHENHNIVMEIYEVNSLTFQSIEVLEGYPHFYDRTQIETSHGKAHVYFLHEKYDDSDYIESGDWLKYMKK